jgi:glycerophosphoryl diester phosphodiesterase
MGDYADALVAVWDGSSRGTAHMIKYAKEKGLKVHVYDLRKINEYKFQDWR